MRNIFDFTITELEEKIVNDGGKKYRATQIFEWLYRKGVKDFNLMTNIGKDNIEYFALNYSLEELKIEKMQVSSDGTRKFLFKLRDDNYIESVLMKQDYGYSLCVSSQVGCNMACAFCASGQHKKVRNLETWEMVCQVKQVNDELRKDNLRLSHVVVMGIGEPFDNYDNLLKFLSIINYAKGIEIGSRHITVSTSGIIPKIYEFANFPLQINLAISLHFPNDELRSKYMPVNKAYPLGDLIQAVNDYFNITGRRVTFEYILIDGINDTTKCAYELTNLVRGMNCYINLIPMNETNTLFRRSKQENAKAFFEILHKNGINATMRKEQGHDIDAACGQLRIKTMKEKNEWKD